MKYRYFYSPIDEVKEYFYKNYDDVLYAETQEEYEEIFEKCKTHDFLENTYSVLILDSFLFFDILTQDNIDYLKYLKGHFKYIVFCGDKVDEIKGRLEGIKKKKH